MGELLAFSCIQKTKTIGFLTSPKMVSKCVVGCSKSRLVLVMKLTVLNFPCACIRLTCSARRCRGWRDSKCTVDSIGRDELSYLVAMTLGLTSN